MEEEEEDFPTSDDEWTLSLDPDDDEITQPHQFNKTPQTSSNDGFKIMTNLHKENMPKNPDNNNGNS